MDIFRYFTILMLTTAAYVSPAPSVNHNAYEFNNTSVFTQIVPTSDLSIRDAIYKTPALMFVGKSNGDILRCLFNDPSVCEMFYSYSSSTEVTSTAVSGEYLFASLANGVMLRCELYQKNSCRTFGSFNTAINGLAISGSYIHAALNDGRMLRCDLHQPDNCKTLNQLEHGIMSLAATEKVIYAGLASKEIWRCAIASENSCRLIKGPTPYSQIRGITAIEETVIGVTEGGTIWNCTRGYNCTTISVADSGYTSLVMFEKSFYTLQNSNIWVCKWETFSCSTYDHHEGAVSISFAHSTYKMQDRFINEEKTCLSEARCPPFIIHYEINKRPALEVFVKRGKLYNSRGELVDTRNADEGQAGAAAVFAMGADGQILLSNVHYTILRTSSLFAGQPVAGAGEMVVEKGVIKSIRACSEHYRPTVELNQQVITALYMKGYTDRIDNLPCCRNNECDHVDVDQNTISNRQ